MAITIKTNNKPNSKEEIKKPKEKKLPAKTIGKAESQKVVRLFSSAIDKALKVMTKLRKELPEGCHMDEQLCMLQQILAAGYYDAKVSIGDPDLNLTLFGNWDGKIPLAESLATVDRT